jgi:hypothetical protein
MIMDKYNFYPIIDFYCSNDSKKKLNSSADDKC